MDSKTIVNDEQNNESKLTQDTDSNVDHRPVDLSKDSKSDSLSESIPSIEDTAEIVTDTKIEKGANTLRDSGIDTSSSTRSPIVSLFGLIAITAGLYYGIPFIRDSLKGMTSEIAELREKSTNAEENIDKIDDSGDENLITKSKPFTETGFVDPLTKVEILEEYVESALIEAVWIDKKTRFNHVRSKASKDKKKIRTSFTFDGNQYDLIFNFNQDFELYEADISEVKFKTFFSKTPSFELN